MTSVTRNEAAERLLLFVEDELQPQFKSSAGYRDWQEAARKFFTAALAAERRATVERIRSAYLASQVPDGSEEFYRGIGAASANLRAILDEVAK